MSREPRSVFDSVLQSASDGAAAARGYLGSEEGKRLRGNVAKVVLIGAPLFSQLPIVRRSPLARLLRTAAFAALVVKGAEWLRDWEPN